MTELFLVVWISCVPICSPQTAHKDFYTCDVYNEQIKGNRERELAIEVEKIKIEISEKLVEIREGMKLTQVELAKKMGVS